MAGYMMILKHQGEGLTLEQKEYNGTLEELHDACECDCIMIYNAIAYLDETLPALNGWHDLLVVCDDDGKIKEKPATLPIIKDGKIVDLFVGDLAFISADPKSEGDDRGLTMSECLDLCEAFDSLRYLPKS